MVPLTGGRDGEEEEEEEEEEGDSLRVFPVRRISPILWLIILTFSDLSLRNSSCLVEGFWGGVEV